MEATVIAIEACCPGRPECFWVRDENGTLTEHFDDEAAAKARAAALCAGGKRRIVISIPVDVTGIPDVVTDEALLDALDRHLHAYEDGRYPFTLVA